MPVRRSRKSKPIGRRPRKSRAKSRSKSRTKSSGKLSRRRNTARKTKTRKSRRVAKRAQRIAEDKNPHQYKRASIKQVVRRRELDKFAKAGNDLTIIELQKMARDQGIPFGGLSKSKLLRKINKYMESYY